MKNIRKKLLSMQVSLITAIAIRVEILRGRFRKNELIDPCATHERICEVEKSDIEFDAEIESPRESILERVDREMIEYAQEGTRGVRLLFTNLKFIGAALAKRTDIIALILEQYYILGSINGATIQSFLDSHYFSFTEEEKEKLCSLIEIDSKRMVLA
jgi:hypothetical protein